MIWRSKPKATAWMTLTILCMYRYMKTVTTLGPLKKNSNLTLSVPLSYRKTGNLGHPLCWLKMPWLSTLNKLQALVHRKVKWWNFLMVKNQWGLRNSLILCETPVKISNKRRIASLWPLVWLTGSKRGGSALTILSRFLRYWVKV